VPSVGAVVLGTVVGGVVVAWGVAPRSVVGVVAGGVVVVGGGVVTVTVAVCVCAGAVVVFGCSVVVVGVVVVFVDVFVVVVCVLVDVLVPDDLRWRPPKIVLDELCPRTTLWPAIRSGIV
jgi:hypothetical protein